MNQKLRPCRLVPNGFIVEHTALTGDHVTIHVRAAADRARCPACSAPSRQVQSRYTRHVADLPLGGRQVALSVTVRRFRCKTVSCGRQIFAERFPDGTLTSRARRTGRLDHVIHHLGLALGGRPAASLARRLMIPVSNDTLLRTVRRRAQAPNAELTTIGIDDFAFRRNHRYGTIVCDLERRRIVKLLPGREPATAQAWLRQHPRISLIARDRGGGYGEAAARALPDAIQVADRWHLLENASRAFLEAVRRSMRQIRTVIGATQIKPDLLTAAERIQYEGYQRRVETNAVVSALARDGIPIRQIVKRTGLSRGTVRQIVRGQRTDVLRSRQNSLEAELPWLDAQWEAGHRNAAALWRTMRHSGFKGSLRVVTEWGTRRRRAERMDLAQLARVPSARTLARLMTTGRTTLTKSEAVMVVAIEEGVPALVEAREIIAAFQEMVRAKDAESLPSWHERAGDSLVASFGNGTRKDEAAVRAAISSMWSNGQTEGQITKLKLVKRQMYGRAKIDLLEARLIGAA